MKNSEYNANLYMAEMARLRAQQAAIENAPVISPEKLKILADNAARACPYMNRYEIIGLVTGYGTL